MGKLLGKSEEKFSKGGGVKNYLPPLIVAPVIIDIIFLYWGLGMGMNQVAPIMLFSYLYKVVFSVANTPLLYLFVFLVREGWNRIKNFWSAFAKIATNKT